MCGEPEREALRQSRRCWPARDTPPSGPAGARYQPPPTPGTGRSRSLGMANFVFSVAAAEARGLGEMPTPPPITMPSAKATIGLG